MFKRLNPLQDAVGDAERRFTPVYVATLTPAALYSVERELLNLRETVLAAFRQQAAIKVKVYNPSEMLDAYHRLLGQLDALLLLVEFWKPHAARVKNPDARGKPSRRSPIAITPKEPRHHERC